MRSLILSLLFLPLAGCGLDKTSGCSDKPLSREAASKKLTVLGLIPQ
jgi:hypothetical protein